MKMDIGTPVELIRFECTDFGAARQAYLTFLNESPRRVTALSGRLTLLDAAGAVVESRRTAFGHLRAEPGQPFVCVLSLDGCPVPASATVLVEDVVFEAEEAWSLHPQRLKEYETPALEDGPDRNALIAIAGHDAVCFPARQENTWLCACGRYNRWRWTHCRRCQRQRDATLADLTPEKVRAAHAARIEKVRQAPPHVLMDGTRRGQSPPPSTPRKTGKGRTQRLLAIVAGCVVLIALIWGIVAMARRPSAQDRVPEATGQTQTAAPDYLLPIR